MASVLERTKATLKGFTRQELEVNGISTVVYSAGRGDPLVYLHGSGTFPGFAFAEQWLQSHRVFIPYHPGFGESGDDPGIGVMQDYVLHYLDLFDALKIDRFSLVGSSLGGWMAAELAISQQSRIERLVLAAPGGLVSSEYPGTDLFSVHPRDMVAYLVEEPEVLTRFMPTEHDLEFLTLRYREATAAARLVWERPAGDPRLVRWIHRIKNPTLLVWGDRDRVRPIEQAQLWLKQLPNARLLTIEGVGHLALEENAGCAEQIRQFLNGN